MARLAQRLARRGITVGLVPTMGALHEGHLSLIRTAAAQTDHVIVTIFVNPLQFGPREGFTRYPRTLRRDVRLARHAGADIVFAPAVEEIYPERFQTSVEVKGPAQRWEGALRPGHFRGVATVVTILFSLTHPAIAYFGQKDYQQVRIVEQLVQDLRLPLRIRMLPTVRATNGLAMSSRNVYLSAAQREQAAALYRALVFGRERIRRGMRSAPSLIQSMQQLVKEAMPGVQLDYLAVTDAKTLEPLRRLQGQVAILIAAKFGNTRLIDNILVDVP